MSNSFLDKKYGIIGVLVLVVLAVLAVFIFEFKLGGNSGNKPAMYSASGKFEKLALAKDKNGNNYFQIYFISDFDKSEKIGELKTGSLFYIVSIKNGKTTTKPGNILELERGDTVIVFSTADISRNKTLTIARLQLIK